MEIQLINTLLLLLCLAALYVLYRKIKRVDAATWDLPSLDYRINQAELRLYHQLEALDSLNALIRPVVPLPPLREWAGSPDFLLEIAKVILQKKPLTIVECSSGSSTLVAARCCQLNGSGHVYSLEHESVFAEATRNNLREAGLEGWATVIHAPLKEHELSGAKYPWYDLSELPNLAIDLLVVDGPPAALAPQSRYPAGPYLVPHLSQGGAIMLDDADRRDEREIVKRWQQQFPQLDVQTRPAEKGLRIIVKT